MRICETLNSQTPVQTTAHAYPIEARDGAKVFPAQTKQKKFITKARGAKSDGSLIAPVDPPRATAVPGRRPRESH